MPKQKSSASSATRKKHARKAATGPGEAVEHDQQPKKTKKDKNAPKIKQYIPPSKPAPVRPDPLDVGGLAARVDPDLLVILRRIGKKDAVTKRRALEELSALAGSSDRESGALSDVAPVWAHYFGSLALHSARRVRALTASTHAALFPFIFEHIDIAPMLGPWCMLAHDADRSVALSARSFWEAAGAPLLTTERHYELESLDEFVSRAVIDPFSLHNELNPSPAPAPHPPRSAAKRPSIPSAVPTPSQTPDLEEETLPDRNSRLRIGGLGALGWLLTHLKHRADVLRAPQLWRDGLNSQPGSFGDGQPGVRRATWTLLGTLIPTLTADDNELVTVLSHAVLQNAWVELDSGVRLAMWEPLLVFLNKFPQAWLLAQPAHDHSDEDEEESDAEDAATSARPDAYAAFLQFLTLACNGAAARGYPTVLVTVNTIPPQILGDATSLFSSLWAAVDGQALGTPDAARAFLLALIECALWSVSRKINLDEAPGHFARAWRCLITKELRCGHGAALILGDGLVKLAKMDESLFETAWTAIGATTRSALSGTVQEYKDVEPSHAMALLKDLLARQPGTEQLIVDLARHALSQTPLPSFFVSLLDTFGAIVARDGQLASDLTALAQSPSTDPKVVLLFMSHTSDSSARQATWHSLLARAAQDSSNSILEQLLHHIPPDTDLRPSADSNTSVLDAVFDGLIERALSPSSSSSASYELAAKILLNPAPLVTSAAVTSAEARLSSCITLTCEAVLRDASVDVAPARVALKLMAASPATSDAWTVVRPKAFLLTHLVPGLGVAHAHGIPVVALQHAAERSAVLLELHDLLLDTTVLATPAQILDVALRAASRAEDVLGLLFPNANELETLRRRPSGAESYHRILDALLPLLTSHRTLAKDNIWVLPHLASRADSKHHPSEEALLAYLLVLPADESDRWLARVADALQGTAAQKKTALSPLGRIVVEMTLGCTAKQDAEALEKVLKKLMSSAADLNDAEAWVRVARSLERSVPLAAQTILRSVTSTELDPPLLVRYRTELSATLSGVPPSKANTEGVRLLRILNSAAPMQEQLLPQQRAVFLVKSIEKWIVGDDADDLDVDVEKELLDVFGHLVVVLQSVPGKHWETVLDLVETNLENANWVEDGDDECELLERTLKLLGTVLELVKSTKMLRNDYWQGREKTVMGLVLKLLESCGSGEQSHSPVKTLCMERLLALAPSIPSSLLDHNTLSNSAHLLTSGSSAVLQQAYPFLAEAAARRTEHFVFESAAAVPVEGEQLQDETSPKVALPDELLLLVQRRLDVDDELDEVDEADGEAVLTAWQSLLWAWTLVFDSFGNASTKVKTAYTEQMRDLDLIDAYFAPSILGLLNVGASAQRKPMKLDVWSVDEFDLSLYDSTTSLSAKLLAAHLYFRALATVPSLIRAWFVKTKDRQLSASVSTFTSTTFSPSLISTSLAPLRSSDPPTIADDNWALRVTQSDAQLTYTVDEQHLEISVRLPSDWPLRTVEVREVKKIGGIPENKWRAWIFGLQVVAGRGDIKEGLAGFKKNVEGHFEGQVECAICYCIISVTDQSLPTKPCRTCKNRFHASCLYKWFKTSHASTCPLCRTDIL